MPFFWGKINSGTKNTGPYGWAINIWSELTYNTPTASWNYHGWIFIGITLPIGFIRPPSLFLCPENHIKPTNKYTKPPTNKLKTKKVHTCFRGLQSIPENTFYKNTTQKNVCKHVWTCVIPLVLIVNVHFWNYYVPSRAYAR